MPKIEFSPEQQGAVERVTLGDTTYLNQVTDFINRSANSEFVRSISIVEPMGPLSQEDKRKPNIVVMYDRSLVGRKVSGLNLFQRGFVLYNELFGPDDESKRKKTESPYHLAFEIDGE